LAEPFSQAENLTLFRSARAKLALLKFDSRKVVPEPTEKALRILAIQIKSLSSLQALINTKRSKGVKTKAAHPKSYPHPKKYLRWGYT
jgi:hypothetical protein